MICGAAEQEARRPNSRDLVDSLLLEDRLCEFV